MNQDNKLMSLSIFFPFYNDEGTVEKQITEAYEIGSTLTDDLEVIAICGGASKDKTRNKIMEMQLKYPNLAIVDKSDNTEGYAVIKYGLRAATKEWVFYTDGDAQYHLNELPLLVEKQLETNADIVNGYKKHRGDGWLRWALGDLYAKFSRFIFELPIRDTDCDFRLMRRSYLAKIDLVSKDSSILGEMIKKLELLGAKFVEVPVSHYPREYGKSNYTPFGLFKEKLLGDLKLYFKLKGLVDPMSSLRIVKFGLVGISSIVIQTVFFNIFLIFTKTEPGLATIYSDQIAIVTSFILNNHITFKDRTHKDISPLLIAFVKYYSIVIVSTLIQSFIVFVGTGVFGKNLIISNVFFILGLGVTFFWNYAIQKRIVWNKKTDKIGK